MDSKDALPDRNRRKNKQYKQIEEIVDESLPKYCVYVLECSSPKQVSEIEEPHNGAEPIRVGQAIKNDQLIYVGYSKQGRIEDRLYHHNRGTSAAAKFTQQFEPMSVREIRWYNSEKKARKQEAKVADEYRSSSESRYVYHRHNRHEEFHWDL